LGPALIVIKSSLTLIFVLNNLICAPSGQWPEFVMTERLRFSDQGHAFLYTTGWILSMNIYVGNLPYSVTKEELLDLFSEFGQVSRATVVMDRETNRSKGFGFVEMPDDAAATQAVEAMNGNEVNGRALRVNEARPREDRPRTPRTPRQ
tara:strand:+ start:46 stop:492 length:447 start_codon:yes stop_codon:yes gene_type:complete